MEIWVVVPDPDEVQHLVQDFGGTYLLLYRAYRFQKRLSSFLAETILSVVKRGTSRSSTPSWTEGRTTGRSI